MAYAKGQRNAGLRLLNDVQRYAPRQYITMTTEATSVDLTKETKETEDGRRSEVRDEA